MGSLIESLMLRGKIGKVESLEWDDWNESGKNWPIDGKKGESPDSKRNQIRGPAAWLNRKKAE